MIDFNGTPVILFSEQRGQFLVHYREEVSWFHPEQVGLRPVYLMKAAATHVPTGITATYKDARPLGPPSPEARSWAMILCQRKAQETIDAMPRVEMEPAEFDPLDRETWGNFLDHQRIKA